MLQGVVIDDTQLFNDKLAEWQDFYNYHRPHGSLGGQTPYERLKQKTNQQRPPSKRSTSAAHSAVSSPTRCLTDQSQDMLSRLPRKHGRPCGAGGL